MKKWQRQSINKSLENYAKTKDIEHLVDIVRIYTYKKPSVGRRLAKIFYKFIIPRKKGT